MNLNITLQIVICKTLLIPYYTHCGSENRSRFPATLKPDRISISNISAIDISLTSVIKLQNHPSTLFSPSKSPCGFFFAAHSI